MKKNTKIIAVILALVSLLTVCVIPASAAYSYPMSCAIYYKDEKGKQLAPTRSFSVNATEPGNTAYASPSIDGYSLKNDSDAYVSYSMMKKSFPASNYVRNGSASYTVVYVKNTEAIIRYIYGSSMRPAAGEKVVNGKPGSSYSVTSPYVTGYTPTSSTVTGTFGTSTTSTNVYYYEKVYNIQFDANGGSGAPATMTKAHFTPLTIPTKTPSRTGYTFLGWSWSNTATTAFYKPGDSMSLNGDDTLYAVWSRNKYTISFDANGGSGAPSSITKLYGVNLTLPNTIPTKSGFDFLGWATYSTATTASYATGGTWTGNYNQTLYAVWQKTPERYTVYYNANGGTNAPASQTKIENVALTLSFTTPTRTGYTFQGWATSSTSSTVSYQAGGSYTRNSGITLYAVWKPLQYTIGFDANGGSGAPSSVTKTHDTTITLPNGIPSRDHYKFLGWSANATASYPDYYAGDVYDEEGSKTLYAVWEFINYDLSVSNLTVEPDSLVQYDNATVRFRIDSWDQKNAYTNIPVTVLLNGSPIYSTRVDVAVYGVQYVTFTLNLASNYGNQILVARVNWDDHLNETRTTNNSVSKYFEAEKLISTSSRPIEPNADYIEGNEVVSSFYISNDGGTPIVPADGVDFRFRVYTLDAQENRTYVYEDTWENVVCPANRTNLVYFKWKIPENSAGTLYWCEGTMNPDGVLNEKNLDNNTTFFNTIIRYRDSSQTPNTRYEATAPSDYSATANAPSVRNGSSTWTQWEYVNGSFVLKSYGIKLGSNVPTLTPDSSCTTATYKNGSWTMKSGYGVQMVWSTAVTAPTGSTLPSGNAYTEPQKVYVNLPDYSYSTLNGKYRTLEKVGSYFAFERNPYADSNARLHFIPVFIKNGTYKMSVTATQIWSPAGMFTVTRNTNILTIDGSIYDDYFVGGKR